jgi:hypothetical protein
VKPYPLVLLVLLAGCTSVQSKIEINAPAKAVRAVFFNFDDYPKWNPFIIKVDGAVADGSKVTVTVRPVGKSEITGATTVTAMTDDHLAWTGSLAIPGVFSGKHDFIIEEVGPNKTVFHNNERMSGVIIPFFDFKPTEAGFVAMNEALKKRAEESPR